MEIVYQGHVAMDGSTKITCISTSLIINNIVINNLDSGYMFTFSRYMTGPGIHQVPIYELLLNQGDSIRDTEQYILEKGNYIQFTSDVVGTTFYVSATQV